MIRLKDIHKSFGIGEAEVKALNGVTLDIEDKEFVAVMGPSGCGKSTLINVLATLHIPDSGEYTLNNVRMTGLSNDMKAELRRRKIAVIFQDYNLVSELTINNNIVLPFVFDHRKYDENEYEKIVNKLEISDVLKRYPNEISGGQKQRAAIARALLINPDIILADEPTGNLDKKNSINVVEMLRTCVDNFGRTVFMVTHDAEIAGYSDRIIYLQDGKAVGEKCLK